MTPEPIEAGALTVAHLADYFEELKEAARQLIAGAQVGGRGYFTPSEEEAVRRLQASYWSSRNALFEVITALRDDRELAEELRPAAFLVAFGAAVLLVDAARFLHESFEPLPLVRHKLNQAEPSFGIPKGTYDKIQKSLTSSRHAWHLYHALRYFEEHAHELRQKGGDPLLAPVLATVERLQSRLQVPVDQYLQARWRVRARRAVGRVRHGLLGRAFYGMQKLVSLMASEISTRPGHRPHLPPDVSACLEQLLQPGDILITRKEHAATNYFLPGYWKHAALYLGNPAALEPLAYADPIHPRLRWTRRLSPEPSGPQRVLEALKDGVWVRPTASPLAADAVAAIRPRLQFDDVMAALVRGLCHEGKPYDFDFDFTRADRLVCTEVVYRSYEGIGGMQFELTRRAGRLTLSAEDLIRMAVGGVGFEPVAVFVSSQQQQLVYGRDAAGLLKQTAMLSVD